MVGELVSLLVPLRPPLYLYPSTPYPVSTASIASSALVATAPALLLHLPYPIRRRGKPLNVACSGRYWPRHDKASIVTARFVRIYHTLLWTCTNGPGQDPIRQSRDQIPSHRGRWCLQQRLGGLPGSRSMIPSSVKPHGLSYRQHRVESRQWS